MTIGLAAALFVITVINWLLALRRRPPRRHPDDLRFFNEERDWVTNGSYPVALQRVYASEPLAILDRTRLNGIGYTATQTRRLDAGVVTEWKRTDRIDTVIALQIFHEESQRVFRLLFGPALSVVSGLAVTALLVTGGTPLSTAHLIAIVATPVGVVLLLSGIAVTWRSPTGFRTVMALQALAAAALVVGFSDPQSASGPLRILLAGVVVVLPLLASTGELLLRRRT